jgi:hypothetical protein
MPVMETPNRRSSSALRFQMVRKYWKFVKVDWIVPRIAANRTFFLSVSGVSSGRTTISVRLQKPALRREISPPICYLDHVTVAVGHFCQLCMFPCSSDCITLCFETAGCLMEWLPVLRRMLLRLGYRVPCQSLAPLSQVSASVASGLSGLDFPRYSGFPKGSLL